MITRERERERNTEIERDIETEEASRAAKDGWCVTQIRSDSHGSAAASCAFLNIRSVVSHSTVFHSQEMTQMTLYMYITSRRIHTQKHD